MKKTVKNSIIELKQADITEQQTDAIVNPANEQLILGAGVAGAIRAKGGPEIQKQCNKIGEVKTGMAVVTSGGRLKAKYIIHAVGPKQGREDGDEKLLLATLNALRIADEYQMHSISFPAISTGVWGFPVQRCAEIMIAAVQEYLLGETGIGKVVFCLFDSFTYSTFMKELLKSS